MQFAEVVKITVYLWQEDRGGYLFFCVDFMIKIINSRSTRINIMISINSLIVSYVSIPYINNTPFSKEVQTASGASKY